MATVLQTHEGSSSSTPAQSSEGPEHEHTPGHAHAGEVDLALISGPPYRTILRLALPTVIAMLSQSVVNEIDVFFFTRLPHPEDSNAQAALLPSLLIVWLFGGSLSAISVGTQAYTARRYAERKYEEAGAVLANAAWFCLVAGIAFAILGAFTIKGLLGLMLPVPEAHSIAYSYSKWRLLGVVSMAMTMAFKAFFDGIGKTWVHLVSAVVMNVFNVLFCWMFIFGNFGAPRMGAPGAGFAAFVSTWIGLGIMIAYATRERTRFNPVRWSNISRPLTWDILKLSIPAALATIVMMVGFGLFTKVAGRLDAAEALAAGVPAAGREAVNGAASMDIVAILKLTFTACLAFGTATATLVAQSLAAKRPDDASRFGWASVRLGVVLFGVVGLFEGVLFTPQIVNLISHSEAVRQAALVPMRMMGIITPVIAVAMILSEALFGAGNTKFVAAAQFCLVFLVLVPLAWVLGNRFGLTGMWSAAVAYAIGAAIVMSTKFRGGSWKSIKL
ncbi:Na+-driven multidrug efflux pump [Labilithrix luteola]|uniref:Multidrug-efflux transporter n=1 Tax=Labilithrix luteola TaxID=1391654 RepID=A0A0K1QGD4_9BACT|nr:MATE family efflux transporter [Labilithrix luteola]AKV04829.1 Na+-driven multidrug efflux pump [Labilithrix luteola]